MSAHYPPHEAYQRSRSPGEGFVGGAGAPRHRRRGSTDSSNRCELTLHQHIRTTADWQRLRAARRFPKVGVTGVVAVYLLSALLANEARGLMGVRVVGHLNVGLSLILLQCVTTVLVVCWYARHANRKLDPLAERLRTDLERAETDH